MENKKRSISTKTFAILLAVVLIIGCMAGGTIAWLISTPDAVVNTFTYGDINIGLGETTGNDYEIIPGVDINKDPKVTVTAGSEACWLFVEVKEAGKFVENKVIYEVDTTAPTGWTRGNETTIPDYVYYREVPATEVTDADLEYYVLKGNTITVSEALTKEDIKDIKTKPTLTFKAYAIQKAKFTTAAAAWAEASK